MDAKQQFAQRKFWCLFGEFEQEGKSRGVCLACSTSMVGGLRQAAFREVLKISNIIAMLADEMQELEAIVRTSSVVTVESCEKSYVRNRSALYGHAVQ